MNEPTVTVRNLVKEFLISSEPYASLKGMLVTRKKSSKETIRALDGISFDAYQGEALAVIGPNGAGKSTLLAILARVYKPTSGDVKINGRVAPLLELGAGFHPDLTGRENVFFNGVVLGLTRKQVAERMEDIIEFSEIGDYIDAHVRTYSSGMLLRLGFSVAVHVDANILLVDEALAVGDIEFQRKCLHRISEFLKAGGTAIFVSHDMDAVLETATRAIWLQGGKILKEGRTLEVVSAYQESAKEHFEDS
ncbi:MAG TPA: ABC transporter ATP-binding protein [Fimbriimonadales bacterium]|nr:ABC transporter ATP-binding protein [Fimbriimonadales bacterium]